MVVYKCIHFMNEPYHYHNCLECSVCVVDLIHVFGGIFLLENF